MKRYLFGRGGDKSAAVAPTVALSLFALIGAGGIAFDYARMASLDTELQNAADQAALAAATQLDQETRAVERATAAAQGLIANQTRMASDGLGTGITIPTVVFYADKDDAENETNEIDITDPDASADARFVRVEVTMRQADFALTPIVGAFRSGNIGAEAVAGLGQSICKTPPVMMCNPQEVGGNLDFDASGLIGHGIRLVAVGNGNQTWVPGNFGYLDSNTTSNGANGLRESLGWNTPPGDCLGGSGVDTKPGANVPVTDALNTRFDIYDNQSCQSGGLCAASINSVKDVRRSANATPPSGNNACRLHNSGWGEVASDYYSQAGISASTPLPVATVPASMGHPRDMCHAVSINGSCTDGRIGDGLWDRDAYFRVNYRRADGTRWTHAEWMTNTGLSANATRYEVYNWEIAHRDTVIDGVTILGPSPAGASGNTKVAYGKPVCSQAQSPSNGTGFVPGGTVPDRRRISVAVINCTANSVNGNSQDVPVEKWIEVFLVEPSLNRNSGKTNQGDVYVELISETEAGEGATAGQVIRRDVPYLVK
jgi:hypothetical protein